MLVEITKEDLENGKPRDCTSCALAMALKRTHSTTFVFVDRLFAYVGPNDMIRLTREAIRFTKDFDDPITRKSLKPTTLEIGELHEPSHH